MGFGFSEEQVHDYIFTRGMEALIVDSNELTEALLFGMGDDPADGGYSEHGEFKLWKIIKQRVLSEIDRVHSSIRYGEFVGSKVDLPTDRTRPMQLDLLGQYEDGLFVMELKVEKGSERNAFSELLGYSNYIAQMFAMAGPQDITNVLVAPMGAKITRNAFLYDLLINNRNVIAYTPVLVGNTLDSLELRLHVPSDEDFRYLANWLLSHNSMACVVASFSDLEGWYDSHEVDSGVNDYTKTHLDGLCSYTAQLMEAAQLHGFAFIRKPWEEMPAYYRNSLVICAINPFFSADPERAEDVTKQLDDQNVGSFFELPRLAFDARLLRLAAKAISESLAHDQRYELETPQWATMVGSLQEVVFTHNFGFRPTGVLREAYVSYLNQLYAGAADGDDEDVSLTKILEVQNWMRAWIFMEMCGFTCEKDGPGGADI